MKLLGVTQAAADKALRLLRRHVPADVEIGVVIAAALAWDGQRYIQLMTRHGHFFLATAGHHARRLRRLDSPQVEPWDTTEGLIEETTYVLGEEVALQQRQLPREEHQ